MLFIYILALDMRFINTFLFLMWESTLKLIKTVEDPSYIEKSVHCKVFKCLKNTLKSNCGLFTLL